MVSEPKAHISKVKAQKRQKGEVPASPGQPLLSYYMASLVGGGLVLPQGLPSAKRPRVALDEVVRERDACVVTGVQVGSESAESGEGAEADCAMEEEIDMDSLKCYSAPDVLICGNCR